MKSFANFLKNRTVNPLVGTVFAKFGQYMSGRLPVFWSVSGRLLLVNLLLGLLLLEQMLLGSLLLGDNCY